MKQQLLIVGAGSVGKFIAYNIDQFTEQFEILGFLDDDAAKLNTHIAGYPVIGPLNDLYVFSGKDVAVVWGIAFPDVKKKLFEKYQHLKFDFPNFIAKNTWISGAVTIGKGVIIYPATSINYECCISDFAVINMNCALGHNCYVGKFSSLAPGVNFAGHTKVGESVDVGIGVSTIQNVVINDNAVIAGQAMVVFEVEAADRVAGIPARSIKKQ